MKRITYLAVIFVVVFVSIGAAHATDWQAEYVQLKAKVEAEEGEPHVDDRVSKDFEEYIYWLGVKAEDRDHAQALAAEASNNGNPYWEKRFLDLAKQAQDSGESTLWMANEMFLRNKEGKHDVWNRAVEKAELFGKRLYIRAQELNFDAEYIRESVRCLMRFALGDVEKGRYLSLYENRDLRCGTQHEGDGSCLPRSVFYVVSEGTQLSPVDKGLSNVDQIRDICEWFQLIEYNDGTVLMNQFLQDFLCDDKHNPDKGLQWYLSLAQKYKLKKSEEHILGFYGTVHGKVEIQEGKRHKAASGAKVHIKDKPKTLETTADDKGRYEIGKAPLHCKCSPYPISAEYEGDRVDSKYEGPLKQPMPSWRHKKDLFIPGSGYEWSGTLSLEVTRRFQCDAEEQTSELGRREVRANDRITQKVNLTIGMDDFNLTKQPAIPGTHLIHDASGEMNGQHNKDHFTASRSDKTWCYSQKWISPGSWNTRHETWSGQADRQIKKENINLLITKDMELNKEAMQDLQKQMEEAAKNNDLAAIQELKGQMVGMVQGNQDNNTIPIRIRIEIVFDLTEKDLVKKTWEYKGDDVCLETDDKNESGTNNIELPIALPMAIEMKGTYTRGKDGRDIITANINKTETSQSDFYKEICPDVITTINGQINLERLRK